MKSINKILGAVCYICPLCILKRKFKDSKFSKTIEKLETKCPFCRAYKKVIRIRSEKK